MYPVLIGEAIESRPIEDITSPHLARQREEMEQARKKWKQASLKLEEERRRLDKIERRLKRSQRFGITRRLFASRNERLEQEIMSQEFKILELADQLEKHASSARLEFGAYDEELLRRLCRDFDTLRSCEKIWDVTNRHQGAQYRSIASHSINRQLVHLNIRRISLLHPDQDALHIANANGADLYIYPSFLVVFDRADRFALIDLRDVQLEYLDANFIEDEQVPRDTVVLGHTWRYANNDGSQDRRFRDNYQIPILAYGDLHFKTASGLNELYMFSDRQKIKQFAHAFNGHKRMLGA